MNLDFAGQTVKEKLDEGVVYFNNPLRDEEEDELVNIKALNTILEQLRNEDDTLQHEKRRLLDDNKEKIATIRDIRGKMESLY